MRESFLEDDDDNSHAWKYIKRVTDKKNLEASNELFAKLVAEIHRRGMKSHSGWCVQSLRFF